MTVSAFDRRVITMGQSNSTVNLPSAQEAQLIRYRKELAQSKRALEVIKYYIEEGKTECALNSLGIKELGDYILLHMTNKGYYVNTEDRIVVDWNGKEISRKYLVWGGKEHKNLLPSYHSSMNYNKNSQS